MSKFNIFLFLVSLVFINCKEQKEKDVVFTEKITQPITEESSFKVPIETKDFDFPVGKPNAKGYYNAQGFGENYYLVN